MTYWSPWKSRTIPELISRRKEEDLYAPKVVTAGLDLELPQATLVVLAVREGVSPQHVEANFAVNTEEFFTVYGALQEALVERNAYLAKANLDEVAELSQIRDRLEEMSDKGNRNALKALHGYVNSPAARYFPANRVGLISPILLRQLTTPQGYKVD